jgi:hypothetical protein
MMKTFEPLLGVQVNLLCLRDFFQKVLNDHPIKIPRIT